MIAILIIFFFCIAGEHGTKQSPCFCFSRKFWFKNNVPKIPLLNGESASSFNNLDDQNKDIEMVPRWVNITNI